MTPLTESFEDDRQFWFWIDDNTYEDHYWELDDDAAPWDAIKMAVMKR